MINWKVRFKNPVFISQLIMSVIFPIVGYVGINVSDITSWGMLGNLLIQAASNPYILAVVAVSVYNAITDPTTRGVGDSYRAMTYDYPN
jgi:phi LC3 family holin